MLISANTLRIFPDRRCGSHHFMADLIAMWRWPVLLLDLRCRPGKRPVRFAAGEFSNGGWGFLVPDPPETWSRARHGRAVFTARCPLAFLDRCFNVSLAGCRDAEGDAGLGRAHRSPFPAADVGAELRPQAP